MLMTPLAPLSVLAEVLFVKGTAVLCLEDFMSLELLLSQLIDFRKLFISMCKLTASSILAEAALPVLADVSLILSIALNLG